jgi:hypothetical protein
MRQDFSVQHFEKYISTFTWPRLTPRNEVTCCSLYVVHRSTASCNLVVTCICLVTWMLIDIFQNVERKNPAANVLIDVYQNVVCFFNLWLSWIFLLNVAMFFLICANIFVVLIHVHVCKSCGIFLQCRFYRVACIFRWLNTFRFGVP